MDKVNKIINHKLYREHYEKIEELEIDRIYCHHDMNHFLDVARIATILSKESALSMDADWSDKCVREIIYSAALLHDIGRDVQYLEGIKHEEASAVIAKTILEECGFGEAENDIIITAIREHGNEASLLRNDLVGIIYRADKLSRKCFACKATDTCHKDINKRNMNIKY